MHLYDQGKGLLQQWYFDLQYAFLFGADREVLQDLVAYLTRSTQTPSHLKLEQCLHFRVFVFQLAN